MYIWTYRLIKLIPGTQTTKYKTGNNLNFIRQSFTTTFHASHGNGRTSKENEILYLRICIVSEKFVARGSFDVNISWSYELCFHDHA